MSTQYHIISAIPKHLRGERARTRRDMRNQRLNTCPSPLGLASIVAEPCESGYQYHVQRTLPCVSDSGHR